MKGIGFKNMKVLKDEQWFDFKKLTILTGTNNSGKSSVINAMKVLNECIASDDLERLLNSEFRVRGNQGKFGGIENFISANSDKGDYFTFIERVRNLEYQFRIRITRGIESYGIIDSVEVRDVGTGVVILDLKLTKRGKAPDTIRINHKYFVERFYQKCRNTEKLIQHKIFLDELTAQVNRGERSLIKLKEQIDKVEREVSVNIGLSPIYKTEEGDVGFDYWVYKALEDYVNLGLDGSDGEVPFDEPMVLFDGDEDQSRNGIISESRYEELFAKCHREGPIHWDSLWKGVPEIQMRFEQAICEYYGLGYSNALQSFNAEIISYLSSIKWEIGTDFFNPKLPLKNILIGLPFFGLFGALITYTVGDETRNFTWPFLNLNFGKDPQTEFSGEHGGNTGQFNRLMERIEELIVEVTGGDFGTIKRLQNELSSTAAYKEIWNDVENSFLNLNLTFEQYFISSSRFSVKRTFNFNDNSDFTRMVEKLSRIRGEARDNAYSFINKWLKEFDLADELILEPDSETGDFKAYLKDSNEQRLIADFGLGTNQLLPVLLALSVHEYKETKFGDVIRPRVVLIEEPEANLHPALQSKLADVFMEASRLFTVQIVIETHSEYLIRKLQYLIATSSYKSRPEDVSIYYFSKVNNPQVISGERKQVEKIEIDRFGRLNKEFGSGFFDEADKISIELFLLSRKNDN